MTGVQPSATGCPLEPPSAATRHLCTGVLNDIAFRDFVIREVHNAPYQRVAPSFDYDLVPVVRFAWRAWWLEIGLLLSVPFSVLFAWFVGDLLAAVIVAEALLSLCLLPVVATVLPDALRLRCETFIDQWSAHQHRPTRRMSVRNHQVRSRQSKAMVVGAAALVITPVAVAEVVGGSPAQSAATACWTVCGLVFTSAAAGTARQMARNQAYGALSLRPAALSPRLATIDAQQRHSCVVYRRPGDPKETEEKDPFFSPDDEDDLRSPFIGSGKLVHEWIPSLTIQLLREDGTPVDLDRPGPEAFSAHDLIDCVRTRISELATGPERARLRGLSVTDRLYIAETALPPDRALLRQPITPERLAEIIDTPDTDADHFLVTTVGLDGGELVTSMFLHVSIKGRTLSLEFIACALPRTREEFRRIDEHAEHGRIATVREAIVAVARLPQTLRRLPVLFTAPVVLARAAWARRDRTLRPRRRRAVGTVASVREKGAQDWDRISQRDHAAVLGRMKIIEQWILTSVEQFLDTHDVDTSMFKKQMVKIVNSGVLNMGGQTVFNSAVGVGAHARAHAGDLFAHARNTEPGDGDLPE
ncbi:hypothetical protein ACFPZ0_06370 [Streptomonospora nanhaiensis]|uniref:hypothetical protein n=1 Tax=Streptomonospora nanhaiensis TaxID=1323731 RepID=UPI001C9A1EFF|nr:hypothetical protein [Streptomonospora nanhaiensis]MBX9387603.1 hypothetical protein [Streptomonospora nanhaiensis]